MSDCVQRPILVDNWGELALCRISKLQQLQEQCDVIFRFPNEDVQAHSLLFHACSPSFLEVVGPSNHECKVLPMPGHVSVDCLKSVLRFVYQGRLLVPYDAAGVLTVARMLRLHVLEQLVQANQDSARSRSDRSLSSPVLDGVSSASVANDNQRPSVADVDSDDDMPVLVPAVCPSELSDCSTTPPQTAPLKHRSPGRRIARTDTVPASVFSASSPSASTAEVGASVVRRDSERGDAVWSVTSTPHGYLSASVRYEDRHDYTALVLSLAESRASLLTPGAKLLVRVMCDNPLPTSRAPSDSTDPDLPSVVPLLLHDNGSGSEVVFVAVKAAGRDRTNSRHTRRFSMMLSLEVFTAQPDDQTMQEAANYLENPASCRAENPGSDNAGNPTTCNSEKHAPCDSRQGTVDGSSNSSSGDREVHGASAETLVDLDGVRTSPDGKESSEVRETSSDDGESCNVEQTSPDGKESCDVIEKSPDGQELCDIRDTSPGGKEPGDVRERSSNGKESCDVRKRSPDGKESCGVRNTSGGKEPCDVRECSGGKEPGDARERSPDGKEPCGVGETSPGGKEPGDVRERSPGGKEPCGVGETSPGGKEPGDVRERSPDGKEPCEVGETSPDGKEPGDVRERSPDGKEPCEVGETSPDGKESCGSKEAVSDGKEFCAMETDGKQADAVDAEESVTTSHGSEEVRDNHSRRNGEESSSSNEVAASNGEMSSSSVTPTSSVDKLQSDGNHPDDLPPPIVGSPAVPVNSSHASSSPTISGNSIHSSSPRFSLKTFRIHNRNHPDVKGQPDSGSAAK